MLCIIRYRLTSNTKNTNSYNKSGIEKFGGTRRDAKYLTETPTKWLAIIQSSNLWLKYGWLIKKKWLNDTALQLRHLSKIYDDMQCLCVLIWNIPWHTSGKHSKYCNHMSSILAVVYEIFSQLTTYLYEKMRCVSCHTFSWKLHIDKRTLKQSLNLITSQRTCFFFLL